MKAKACILTSAHPAFNARVFHKQAKSLATRYDVVLVAPNDKDCFVDGVRIKAILKKKGWRGRIGNVARVLAQGIREKADIYHFHDPELIPAGLVLKAMGKKVIYDVHEYYRMKLKPRSEALSRIYDLLENFCARFYDGLIVVDSVIGAKFGGRAVIVRNFPYTPMEIARKTRNEKFTCAYVGSLSGDRGVFSMVKAMEYLPDDVKLVLAGNDAQKNFLKLKGLKGFEKVEWKGLLSWPDAMGVLTEADLGLLLLQPSPAYKLTGEGIGKLYEYMMFGLPVLVSNFPFIKKIVDGEGCGMTVDPEDPKVIAEKILFMKDNRRLMEGMSRASARAFKNKYNWEGESRTLFSLYEKILKK